jgi:hypothetical protein
MRANPLEYRRNRHDDGRLTRWPIEI